MLFIVLNKSARSGAAKFVNRAYQVRIRPYLFTHSDILRVFKEIGLNATEHNFQYFNISIFKMRVLCRTTI